MKLPIKKKWFDMIKKGDKDLEWRDAHITFICEETGEALRKEITSAIIVDKSKILWEDDYTKKDLDEMFEDDNLIGFALSSKPSLNISSNKDCKMDMLTERHPEVYEKYK